jgi:hypothetical protein
MGLGMLSAMGALSDIGASVGVSGADRFIMQDAGAGIPSAGFSRGALRFFEPTLLGPAFANGPSRYIQCKPGPRDLQGINVEENELTKARAPDALVADDVDSGFLVAIHDRSSGKGYRAFMQLCYSLEQFRAKGDLAKLFKSIKHRSTLSVHVVGGSFVSDYPGTRNELEREKQAILDFLRQHVDASQITTEWLEDETSATVFLDAKTGQLHMDLSDYVPDEEENA